MGFAGLPAMAAAKVKESDASLWHRRQALCWLAGGMGALGLAGCEAPTAPMRVGSIVFPGYELMFLARELGLLDPSRVRMVEVDSSTDVVRALTIGQLEAANLTLDEVLSARADGADLRVVLVLDISAGADVVLARPGIRNLADIKGQRVGVEDGATGGLMLGALLEAAGLKVEQVQKVPVILDDTEVLFQSKKVDVIVTAEPWASMLEAQGAKRLFDSTAIPGRIVDVLAVRATALPRYAEPLRQLVAAHFQALERFQRKPQDYAAQLAPRLLVPPKDVPGVFRGLRLPNAADNQALLKPGGQIQKGAVALSAVMQAQGLLRSSVDMTGLFDSSFLPP